MICKKCKKEFQDDFAFCPHCGAKAPKNIVSSFSNIEYMACCGKNEFEQELERLLQIPPEQRYDYAKATSEIRECYVIAVRYDAEAGHSPREYEVTPDRLEAIYSRERFDIRIGQWNTRYDYSGAYCKKTTLKKSHLRLIGKGVWFDARECENAIKEIESKYKQDA